VPTCSFQAWPGSVPAARGYVTDALHDVPVPVGQTAALLVSELASNVVQHAGGARFEVTVEHLAPDTLWIGVSDTGQGDPVLHTPPVTVERGRGLQLVAALADRWGVRRRRSTAEKTVWFELRCAPPGVTPEDSEPAGRERLPQGADPQRPVS
jgi:hypothetical protein